MVTYNTLLDTTQKELYAIVSGNATVQTYTTNIVDGLPYTNMQKGTGFPYIKIPSPTYTSEKYTFSKRKVNLSVKITIFTTTASVLRELTDAVRTALTAGEVTTSLAKLRNQGLPVSDYRESVLENGKILYENSIDAAYQYIGVVND